MKKVPNLSIALTILARQEAAEHFMHADVDAFGAPGDDTFCVACRGEDKRKRQARKQAEAIARRPMRVIKKDAARRGMPIGSPKWQSFIGRVYDSNYPF